MFAAASTGELPQRKFESRSACEPCAMNSIAGTIHVTTPNALEAEQNIGLELLADFLQAIRKSDRRGRVEPSYRSKRPLIMWPFCRGNKLDRVSSLHHSAREPFQVRFGTAA